MRAQVKILGDGTQELTTIVTNRLQDELGVTTASVAPTRAMVGRGGARVATRIAPIVEKKLIVCTLLLNLLLFLRLYYNHNKNTWKEK